MLSWRCLQTTTIALFVIVIALRLADAQIVPEVLDPKTYRSPSRQFELSVDPSEIYGKGPAKYQMRENGKERWSRALPFTLCEAAVTDRGVVVGYGYTKSPLGWPDHPGDDDPGEFLVAIIGADGKVGLKESTRLEMSRYEHCRPTPIANGLVVDEPNDRAIVRIAALEDQKNESWSIYRLSTAKAAGKQDLAKLVFSSDPSRSVVAVKPVPGTPLTLVHCWRSVLRQLKITSGATFVLMDLQGRVVWSIDRPTDYTSLDSSTRMKLADFMRKGAGIHCDRPGEFSVFLARESERVTFSVSKNTSGVWAVKETSRVHESLEESAEPGLMLLPKRALSALKPLVLSTPKRIDCVNYVAIDSRGQIYAADAKTEAIYVFDSAGRFLHLCRATPEDFSRLVSHPAVSFGEWGDLYFGPADELEFLSDRRPYAHFGSNGERRPTVVWTGNSCWLQPRTGRLLALSYDGAALTDLNSKTVQAIPRRADHCWLAGVQAAAFAADGSFVILADQYEQGPPTVNLFKVDGDPVCTIRLPGLTRWNIQVAYEGRRVVVLSSEGLFFFDRSGTALYRCDAPLAPRHDAIFTPYLIEDGQTLAIFDGAKPVLHRFRLP